MEEKLKRLFEANVVLSNPRLDALIAETMERVNRSSLDRVELSEEESEMLSAAGDASAMNVTTVQAGLKRKIIIEP